MNNSFESILADATRKTELSVKVKPAEGKLELIGEDVVDWSDIPGGSKKKNTIPYYEKEVSQWGTRDLFFFFLHTFKKVVGEEMLVGFAPGQQNILKLQDEMAKILGHRPTTEMTKNYIEWFISNKALMLISKYNCFKMKFMCSSLNIDSFLTLHNFAKPEETEAKILENRKESIVYTEKMMESVYLSNVNNFVLKYGLVLSVIWLMRKRGMSEMKSVSLVKASTVELTGDGKYDDLVSATERHNPYPIWCKFALLSKLLVDLTEETGEFFDIVDIRFFDSVTKFDFLDHKE